MKVFNPVRHGGVFKCPDQFLFAIAIFFSRKHAIKLFDFSLESFGKSTYSWPGV